MPCCLIYFVVVLLKLQQLQGVYMKDVFNKLSRAGISDKKVSELLNISYYSVLAARREPKNARMELVEKITALANEADKLVAAAKKIAKQ